MNAAYLVPIHDVHLRLGFRSGGCGRCFPAWTTWFADALAGRLRPSVVGGVPIEPLDPALTAAQEVPSGAAVSGRPRALAPAVRAG